MLSSPDSRKPKLMGASVDVILISKRCVTCLNSLENSFRRYRDISKI